MTATQVCFSILKTQFAIQKLIKGSLSSIIKTNWQSLKRTRVFFPQLQNFNFSNYGTTFICTLLLLFNYYFLRVCDMRSVLIVVGRRAATSVRRGSASVASSP